MFYSTDNDQRTPKEREVNPKEKPESREKPKRFIFYWLVFKVVLSILKFIVWLVDLSS